MGTELGLVGRRTCRYVRLGLSVNAKSVRPFFFPLPFPPCYKHHFRVRIIACIVYGAS
jgi:hypothetical protein